MSLGHADKGKHFCFF